jgi:tRNA (uracil-5-)-methyltransferase TRM9
MNHLTAEKLSDLVRRNYEEIAPVFDADRHKPIWPEAARLARMAKPGARLLDAGCGNGRLLEVLKNIDYVGVDASKNLLQRARHNYPEAKFVEGDLLELEALKLGRFDEIFCLAALHHLPGKANRALAWQQLSASLKPGGRLVLSVWDLWAKLRFFWPLVFSCLRSGLHLAPYDPGDLVFPWKDSSGRKISARYYHACAPRELRRQAKAAGLEVRAIYKNGGNIWVIANKKP